MSTFIESDSTQEVAKSSLGPLSGRWLGSARLRRIICAGLFFFFCCTASYAWPPPDLVLLVDHTADVPGLLPPVAPSGTAPVPCGNGAIVFLFRDVAPYEGTWAYLATEAGLQVVVDEETPVPGGGGTFDSLGAVECVDGGAIQFIGRGSSGSSGLFEWSVDGGVHLVQAGDASIEGVRFSHVTSVASNLHGSAFKARWVANQTEGGLFYRERGGAARVIVGPAAVLPGQSGPVLDVGFPVEDGDGVLFFARSDGPVERQGLYRWSPTTGIQKVVDDQDPGAGGVHLAHPLVLAGGIGFVADSTRFLLFDDSFHELIPPGAPTVGGDPLQSLFWAAGGGQVLAVAGATAPFQNAVYLLAGDGSLNRLFGDQDIVNGHQALFSTWNADSRSILFQFHTADPYEWFLYQVDLGTPLDIPGLGPVGGSLLALVLLAVALGVLRRQIGVS